jgi:23S rRNA (uracil1939-C5)-methyltransferase
MDSLSEQTRENETPHARWEPPRLVIGSYLARVTGLTGDGLARAEVVETLSEPSEADFLAIYGPAWLEKPELRQRLTTFSVTGGLPEELIEIEVTWSLPRPGRKRARHVPDPTTRLMRVIEAATMRVESRCAVFGVCGGCQFQSMAYSAQLAWKTGRVRDLLRGVGFNEPHVLDAIGCAEPWGYRNHMRFAVTREGQIGLTARGTHRVLPLSECPIADTHINGALAILGRAPQPRPQALVRYGVATGHLLIQPAPDEATQETLVAAGMELHVEDMEEELGGERFRIRPSSFFQTNTAQANVMARLALAALPAGPEVTLVDAYCGVGVFARLMAGQAGRVLAIEESASAVRDARWNLRDAPHVEVIQAKVEDDLPQRAEELDGLVIDPPRAGCQRPVLDALVARRPRVVVYISCDPTTLARDLAYLCLNSGAFRIRSVQPLDMFPQTAHIENVVTLDANTPEEEGRA